LQQEGGHAALSLSRPHLNGWVQTNDCSCSHGNSSAAVLSKSILKAVIQKENSSAQADGLVCDGASTNQKTLKLLVFLW